MKRTLSLITALILVFLLAPTQAQERMSYGVVYTSLNASGGGAGTNGTAYSMPSNDSVTIEWTTAFSAAPGATTLLLQASLDNSTWYTLDTSTAQGGERRQISTAVPFIRARISVLTNAVNVTVKLVAKRGPTGSSTITGGGDASAANQLTMIASLQIIDNLPVLEDAVAGTGFTGVGLLAVRQDIQAALAADGDFYPLTVDANGALRVTGGGGGTQFAEDVAHASGALGTVALAVRNDAGTTLADVSGDYAVLQVDNTGALRVTGGGGGTQYAEDSVHASGDLGTFALVVQQTADAALAVDGDRTVLQVDATGYLKVVNKGGAVDTELPAAAALADNTGNPTVPGIAAYLMSWDGANWDRLTANLDATADSAAITTGPQVMLRATTDQDAITAVADADAVRMMGDTLGRTVFVPGCPLSNRVRGVAGITDGSSTSVLAAQGAGVQTEIYAIEIANSSATDVTVDIRDGTAGSVLWTMMAPATTDTGGGNNRVFYVPLTFTANTAVAADPSAAASTITVSVLGCSAK